MNNDRRFKDCLPQVTTSHDKKYFMLHAFKSYCKQNWKGSLLSEYDAKNFNSFTIDDFKICNKTVWRKLHYHLRENEEYILKSKALNIFEALNQIIPKDESWPDNNPEKAKDRSIFKENKNTEVDFAIKNDPEIGKRAGTFKT